MCCYSLIHLFLSMYLSFKGQPHTMSFYWHLLCSKINKLYWWKWKKKTEDKQAPSIWKHTTEHCYKKNIITTVVKKSGLTIVYILLHCVCQTESQTPQAAASTKKSMGRLSGIQMRKPIMSAMCIMTPNPSTTSRGSRCDTSATTIAPTTLDAPNVIMQYPM